MFEMREELSEDIPLIRKVHEAAFPTATEADLVDALRSSGNLSLSILTLSERQAVGHISFSPVTLMGYENPVRILGLAPVAVLPEYQKRGIGSALIRHGMEQARRQGWEGVVVLGDPEYYSRFGIKRAGDFGLGNEYGAGEEFMFLWNGPGPAPTFNATVRYADEFKVFS